MPYSPAERGQGAGRSGGCGRRLGRRRDDGRRRRAQAIVPGIGQGERSVHRARLRLRARRAPAHGRDHAAAPRGAARQGRRGRASVQELHDLLPRLRRPHRRPQGHQPPGAQARAGDGGRLVRGRDAVGRPVHRRGLQGASFRRVPALLADDLRGGHRRHEAEHLAVVPRQRLGFLRRRGGAHGLRQPT